MDNLSSWPIKTQWNIFNDYSGGLDADNSVAVTLSAAKVKCTCISGFRSANAAGFPFTFTTVADAILLVASRTELKGEGTLVVDARYKLPLKQKEK